MDEIHALKYIFRTQFDEVAGTVTFNNKTYKYSNLEEETFFGHILRSEENSETVKEIKPQIDAQVTDVEKITEEQFKEWKNKRKLKEVDERMTGKMIWMEQKRRGENTADIQ